MTDLHFRSLTSVCRDLKSGALSSVEVTRHMLARIEELEPRTRAFVTVLADRALACATALDAARARGEALGALHGVPVAIKDLLTTKGIRTTCGTEVLKNWRPEEDATVVTRLEAAGAVILGKVKLTEGAFSHHHPQVIPPQNPWGADLWTGVSSSGSGVAVAAGLCFAALGSDTGGSIRFPSASCGIVGIKPTYGLVSRFGAFPLADSLDHIGPMTRCVEDAARVLEAIAGYDAKDATSLRLVPPIYAAALAGDVRGLRVGVDRDYASKGVDPSVNAVVQLAVTALREQGALVSDVIVPEHAALVSGWAVTCGVETALAHAATFPSQREHYGPQLAGLIDLGHRAPASAYAALERERERFRAELQIVFDSIDVLVIPALPTPTPTLANIESSLGRADGTAEFLTFTAPFDYSGHPTITLPAGLSSSGVPLAVQFVAALQGEARLIQAGCAWEKVAGTRNPTI